MSNGWQCSVIMLSSSARFICPRRKNVAYSPPQNSYLCCATLLARRNISLASPTSDFFARYGGIQGHVPKNIRILPLHESTGSIPRSKVYETRETAERLNDNETSSGKVQREIRNYNKTISREIFNIIAF